VTNAYAANHQRVTKARGKAAELTCVDCGGQAQHWSQVRDTTGDDPSHYEPRCAKCHVRYDEVTISFDQSFQRATGLSDRELSAIRKTVKVVGGTGPGAVDRAFGQH
jgi:NAD-dependent SIR2 family protein deacetylase